MCTLYRPRLPSPLTALHQHPQASLRSFDCHGAAVTSLLEVRIASSLSASRFAARTHDRWAGGDTAPSTADPRWAWVPEYRLAQRPTNSARAAPHSVAITKARAATIPWGPGVNTAERAPSGPVRVAGRTPPASHLNTNTLRAVRGELERLRQEARELSLLG